MRSILDCSILMRLPDDPLIGKVGTILSLIMGNDFFMQGYWHPNAARPEKVNEFFVKFRDLHHAAQSKDIYKVAAKKAARAELLDAVKSMANNLELIAWNDPDKLQTTGFDMRGVGTAHASPAELAAAAAFTVEQGADSGVLIGKVKRPAGWPTNLSFEVQYTESDPTIEANWQHFEVYNSCSKMFFKGLVPGRRYSFRVRAIATNRTTPWSPSATSIVT